MFLTLLNAIVLQSVMILAGITLTARLIPGSTKTLASLAAYGSFMLVSLTVGIQMLAGWTDHLTLLSVSLLGYAACAVILMAFGRSAWKEWRMAPENHPQLWLLVLLPLGVLLIVESFNALMLPIWEYDSIAYHSHIIREWYVQESLRIIPFTVFAGPVGYYPSTAELLFLWPLLLLGTDALINIPNSILFLSLVATIIHGLRRAGGRISFLFAPLLLFSPILWKELGSQHVDLFFLLSFLWTILFLWDYRTSGKPVFLALTCAAGGLFLGSKYLAIPFAVPIILLLLLLVVIDAGKGRTWRRLLLPLSVGLGLFILMGGYWYIRNAAHTFNPLFPATLRIGSTVIATGYTTLHDAIFNRSLLHMLTQIPLRALAHMLFTFIDRIGWQSLLIGIAYGALVKDLIKTRCRACWRRTDVHTALLCTFYFFLYIAAPNSYGDFDANIRYSILAVTLGYALVAMLMAQRLLWRNPVGILAALGIGATIIRTLQRPDLPHEILSSRLITAHPLSFALTMLVVVTGILLIVLLRRSRHNPGWHALLVIPLFPILLFSASPLLDAVRTQEKYPSLLQKYPASAPLLRAMQWIETNAPDADIAYTGLSFRSPLYGPAFTRSVQYVPVHACEKCDYAEFRSAPKGIYQDASQEVWLRGIRERHIDYLLIHNERGYLDETMEPLWARSLPSNFQPVLEEDTVILYKVDNI